jgi:hypothetical protein
METEFESDGHVHAPRRKNSDHSYYRSMIHRNHQSEEPVKSDYNKALEDFKCYKTIKTKVDKRYEKIQKFRYNIIPIILFILTVKTISGRNPSTLHSVSFDKIRSFWRKIFLGGMDSLKLESLDSLMSHIYASFYNAYNINNFLYIDVSYQPIEIILIYANLKENIYKQLELEKNFNFDRSNITKVLNLPFELNDEKEFKKFSNTYDVLSLLIQKIFYCLDVEGKINCMESSLKIDCINHGYQYHSYLSIKLIRLEKKSEEYFKLNEFIESRLDKQLKFKQPIDDRIVYSKSSEDLFREYTNPSQRDTELNRQWKDFDGKKVMARKKLSVTHGHQEETADKAAEPGPNSFFDFFRENRFIMLIMLFVAVIALIADFMLYHSIILDEKIEKNFELKLLLLIQEKIIEDKTTISPQKKITFWLLISHFKNILIIFWALSEITPTFLISEKLYYSYIITILTWFSLMEVLNNQKKFGLIFSVFQTSFKNYTKAFIGYLVIGTAFIVTGTLIFRTSDKYITLTDSFTTIFSLMVGDSVLDFFNDLKAYGTFGTCFMLFCIIYFVFVIQSLYITIITDNFFTLVDSDKPEEEIENLTEKMTDSQVKDQHSENRSLVIRQIDEESKETETIPNLQLNNAKLNVEKYSVGEEENEDEDNVDVYSNIVNTNEGIPTPRIDRISAMTMPPLLLEKNIMSLPPKIKGQTSNTSMDLNLNDHINVSPIVKKVRFTEDHLSVNEARNPEIEEKTDIELFNIQHKKLLEIGKTRLKTELEMVNKMKQLIQSNLTLNREEDTEMIAVYLEFIISNVRKQIKAIQKMKNHI